MFEYSDSVLKYFLNTTHVGLIQNSELAANEIEFGAKEEGHWVRLQIVCDQNKSIQNFRYHALGPPALLASCAWVALYLERKSLKCLDDLPSLEIIQALELQPSQFQSAFFMEDALKNFFKKFNS